MVERRPTKKIRVGGIFIGGDAPVTVQSMTKTDTRDITATAGQIKKLEEAGCDIVRVAVPDIESADAIRQIKKVVKIPLAADIHFDYRLALRSMECGADKIRLNPGNIGEKEKVREIVLEARKRGIPIRIGVNSGSIEKGIIEKYGGISPEGMVESALKEARILEELDFHDIVFSLKASSVSLTVEAYKLMAQRTEYPLHIGITEAGAGRRGVVKSCVGLGCLLADGIGDTIRVSLTGDPVEEVTVGHEILKTLGLESGGIELISCPTCGRCRIDLINIVDSIEAKLKFCNKNLKIAIMGCAVNGPGEAKEADIGIAGGKGEALLFKKGCIMRKIPEDRIIDELLAEIYRM